MNKLNDDKIDIGIIGGTGIYDPELIENSKEVKMSTPYGRPSSTMIIGNFEGKKIAFLPRHGRNHNIPPHEINYRANIWSFKKLGVQRIIAPSAVGSLKEELKPGHIVIPDQFIDWTINRKNTFYDGDQVCHISVADPFCKQMLDYSFKFGKELDLPIHKGGTCVVIEGPRFSTKAESKLFRSWGADIINMTIVPECVLARECEICYVSIATITDYDVWKERSVSVDEIVKIINENIEKIKKLIKAIIIKIPKDRDCECKDALSSAIL